MLARRVGCRKEAWHYSHITLKNSWLTILFASHALPTVVACLVLVASLAFLLFLRRSYGRRLVYRGLDRRLAVPTELTAPQHLRSLTIARLPRGVLSGPRT